MKTIRLNTFETNSSSEHVVTICGAEALKNFKDGKTICVYDLGYSVNVIPDKAFIPLEKAFEDLKSWYEKGKQEDSNWDEADKLFKNGFTFEDFKKVILNNQEFEEIGRCMLSYILGEDVYDNTEVNFYDADDCENPFNLDETEGEDFSGIKGPITIIDGEVAC
ncbi:MAG: hypothetical protein IKK93_00470 [Campylobacter sp.]|nr:hypothetical protein [Campylobacter sp.]